MTRNDIGQAAASRKLALIDRDGTLIEERHYLCDPEGVVLLPGAVEGLLQLRRLGYGLMVVTNQAGIGRGYYRVEQMHSVNERMRDLFAAEGVEFDGIFYCPHAPDVGCNCRKPNRGMADQAFAACGFTPSSVAMIGDKALDIEFGKRIGAKTVLVLTGYGAKDLEEYNVNPDYVATDLVDAARHIENTDTKSI